MAVKGQGNTTVTYNGNALTNYCNQADLSVAIEDLETTHFGSSGRESIAGVGTWSISLAGDFDSVVDGYVAPDAITTGTKRTGVIAFTDDGGTTVTYTWTSNAEIGEYSVTSTPTGKIEWSGTLRLSGAPTRAAA